MEIINPPNLVLFDFALINYSLSLYCFVTILLVYDNSSLFNEIHLSLGNICAFDCAKETNLFLSCFNHDMIQSVTL